MKIVEKNEKLIEEMKKYRYSGFLSYLMVHNDKLRNLFINYTLNVKDAMSSYLSNEVLHENQERTFDVVIQDSKGYFYNFNMLIQRSIEDMIFSIELMCHSNDEEVVPQLRKLLILSDSDHDCFPKYIQKFDTFKKTYYVDESSNKMFSDESFEYFVVYQLDHILNKEELNDFDEIMYLIKFNEELKNGKSEYIELLKQVHQEYLESEDFIHDYQWEMDNYKNEDVS